MPRRSWKLLTRYRRHARVSLDALVTTSSAILQAIVSLRVVGLEPPLVLRQKDSQGRFLSFRFNLRHIWSYFKLRDSTVCESLAFCSQPVIDGGFSASVMTAHDTERTEWAQVGTSEITVTATTTVHAPIPGRTACRYMSYFLFALCCSMYLIPLMRASFAGETHGYGAARILQGQVFAGFFARSA